jgi:hypothetical protein
MQLSAFSKKVNDLDPVINSQCKPISFADGVSVIISYPEIDDIHNCMMSLPP